MSHPLNQDELNARAKGLRAAAEVFQRVARERGHAGSMTVAEAVAECERLAVADERESEEQRQAAARGLCPYCGTADHLWGSPASELCRERVNRHLGVLPRE